MDYYKNLEWTFNSSLNSNTSVTADASKVTQPGWLSQLADGQNHTVTNIPYCWGGFNAGDFVDKISSGYYAGNVNTSASGYVSGTVGMDCSGYVSVVFGLPYKHGTATLSNCFELLSMSDAAAYDIFNKPNSHVMIITNVYLLNGVKHVNTYEQTAGEGKIVVRTARKLEDIVGQGYNVMRYQYWQ